MRLDAEKLETLRRWGHGLETDDHDEIRSAGRAILLLIEEIERLHIDLWHARTGRSRGRSQNRTPAGGALHSLATSLRARLARRLS